MKTNWLNGFLRAWIAALLPVSIGYLLYCHNTDIGLPPSFEESSFYIINILMLWGFAGILVAVLVLTLFIKNWIQQGFKKDSE